MLRGKEVSCSKLPMSTSYIGCTLDCLTCPPDLHFHVSCRHIPQLTVEDICNLLWAVAMLGGPPSIMQLISPLVERLQFSSTLLPARVTLPALLRCYMLQLRGLARAQLPKQCLCTSLQELGRALWAFVSTGLLSEKVATLLKAQEAAAEGADAETLQQVAAAYCALPALAKQIPQSWLLQAVEARSHQVASSATSQVNSTALDSGALAA